MVELVLRLFYRTVKPSAVPVGGAMLLHYRAPFRIFVIIVWCILIAGLVASIARPPRGKDMIYAGALGAFFFILNAAMHLEFFGVSILYDETGIEAESPWRRSRRINCSDITQVKYNELAQWYLIKTLNQGSIRCHSFLSGTRSLLKELERHGFEIPIPRSDPHM
jgi:hypothetical protein